MLYRSLSQNSFTGNIPVGLPRLTKLSKLEVDTNYFSGAFINSISSPGYLAYKVCIADNNVLPPVCELTTKVPSCEKASDSNSVYVNIQSPAFQQVQT
jgi:hypothetical protein